MNPQIELFLLVIKLAFLACVLGFVGFAVRKFLNALSDSRQQSRMREQAMVAASHARARARAR